MNDFSGIVRISNFSDFIEPSQKCVLPLKKNEQSDKEFQNLVKIHAKNESKIEKKEQKIKVTLNDCLACSGCITTAETMLVENQTVEQMFKGILNHSISVITVSPQSLCSLAVYFNKTPHIMAKLLTKFFYTHNVKYIFDSSFFRLLAQKLYFKEFYANSIFSDVKKTKKTIFVGACPGFVCYAEKTHGDLFVPYISRVRSPQAISGAFVKDFLKRKFQIKKTSDIFHISIMPCYDKKLEASRKDFLIDNCNEVDCVITPSELYSILDTFFKNNLFTETVDQSILNCQINWLNRFELGNIIGEGNEESSGGYANYIVQQILLQMPHVKCEKIKKNKDWEEFTINLNSQKKLTIAKIYGFRNIQNVVQKIKREKFDIDFVEIMACPSGCSNGGGQIRGKNSNDRVLINNSVNDNYKLLKCNINDILVEIDEILKEWFFLNNNYENLLFANYHIINNNKLLETW